MIITNFFEHKFNFKKNNKGVKQYDVGNYLQAIMQMERIHHPWKKILRKREQVKVESLVVEEKLQEEEIGGGYYNHLKSLTRVSASTPTTASSSVSSPQFSCGPSSSAVSTPMDMDEISCSISSLSSSSLSVSRPKREIREELWSGFNEFKDPKSLVKKNNTPLSNQAENSSSPPRRRSIQNQEECEEYFKLWSASFRAPEGDEYFKGESDDDDYDDDDDDSDDERDDEVQTENNYRNSGIANVDHTPEPSKRPVLKSPLYDKISQKRLNLRSYVRNSILFESTRIEI